MVTTGGQDSSISGEENIFVSDIIMVLSQHHTELREAYHPTASVVLSHVSTRF